MDTKQILSRGVEIVTFLFAAFGHFLLDVAPPEEGRLGTSIGIASILTLGVLLFISALARGLPKKKHRRAWLGAGGGLLVLVSVALPWYRSNLAEYTFGFPSSDSPTSFVRGTQLSSRAEAYWAGHPQKTVQEVVADFGGAGARTLVWTEASIHRVSTMLAIHYLVVVLGLATAIFCLTEGLAGATRAAPSRRAPPAAVTGLLAAAVAAHAGQTLELSLVPQAGHVQEILSIDVSSDGQLLASAGADNVVILWDATSNGVVRRFEGHKSKVAAVRFSPADGNLVTVSEDGTMRLWDVRTGKELRTAKAPVPFLGRVLGDAEDRNPKFYALDVAGDGRVVAGYTTGARIWDPASGISSKKFGRLYFPVHDVAISRDGRLLATAQGTSTTYLWSVDSGSENAHLRGHRETVQAVAMSADGTRVASGAKDGAVLLWEPGKGQQGRVMCSHAAGVNAIRFSPDGSTLASGAADGSLLLCDVSSGRVIRQLRSMKVPVRSLAFHPDGALSAAISSAVLTWDLTTTGLTAGRTSVADPGAEAAEQWLRLPQHFKIAGVQSPSALAVSRDRRLACTSYGRTLVVWEPATGTTLTQIPSEDRVPFTAAAFDRSAGRLAVGRGDGGVAAYELPSGKRLASAPFFTKGVDAVHWARDDKAVVASSEEQMGRWVPGSSAAPSPENQGTTTKSMAMSADERFFAFGGNNAVGFFDLRAKGDKGDKISRKPGHVEAVTFDLQGRHAATAGWKLLLWSLPTFETRELKGGGDSMFTCVDFSPDGRTLATGSVDGVVRVWNVGTGTNAPTLARHTEPVAGVFFTADGRWLWSAGFDGSLRLWSVADGKEAGRLIRLDDGTQALVGADGRFDTPDPDGLSALGWVVGDAPLRVLPTEVFVRDYFEPRLLERLIAGEPLPRIRDLRELNRVQPRVQVTSVTPVVGTRDKVTVRVRVESVTERQGTRGVLESQVYDVRLLRDGSLVAYRDGRIAVGPDNSRELTFSGVRVPLGGPDRKAEFSAYAFNVDRVKSVTGRLTYDVPRSLRRVPKVYVVSVGVTTTTDSHWTLDFAGEDARVIGARLSAALQDYGHIVRVKLAGSPLARSSPFGSDPGDDEPVVPTKASIKAVLDLLSGRPVDAVALGGLPQKVREKLAPVEPADLFVFSISAHGVARNRELYLLPYDIGTGSQGRVTDSFLHGAISSAELSTWLRDVDAGQSVMIVDACYGRAAVDGADFKPAPLGNRGFGQLSYDKGMTILVAAQSDAVAVESNGLSLLTRAFALEGLSGSRAASGPGPMTLTGALVYAAARVPQLAAASAVKGGTLQRPWLFDFRKTKQDVALSPTRSR